MCTPQYTVGLCSLRKGRSDHAGTLRLSGPILQLVANYRRWRRERRDRDCSDRQSSTLGPMTPASRNSQPHPGAVTLFRKLQIHDRLGGRPGARPAGCPTDRHSLSTVENAPLAAGSQRDQQQVPLHHRRWRARPLAELHCHERTSTGSSSMRDTQLRAINEAFSVWYVYKGEDRSTCGPPTQAYVLRVGRRPQRSPSTY